MRRVLLLLILIVLAATARVRSAALQAELATDGSVERPALSSSSPFYYSNCRFGVAASKDILSYDTALLNLGWYVNWTTSYTPETPDGMEFVQMVRLVQTGSTSWDFGPGQSWTSLSNTVAANPGATWLIGNEPDSPFQDDITPEAYSYAYHDVYYQIKDIDATAQVGIGGVVQPTPLRFEYLDQVWDAYYQVYSETMPVDVWNIHTFILRETAIEPDPEPCGPNTTPKWGGYIPPGIDALTGELYCVRDQDNLEIFWQRIRDFRGWMASKGERDKPLIITEYGVLFYEDYHDEDGRPFDQERVGRFMEGTFDLLLNETDEEIGYPYDGNRLVQRWAWFSLSESPYEWGGTLFDPGTHELRQLGQTFREYTNFISPAVDLLAARIYPDLEMYEFEGQPVTVTLKAVVSNIGNISTTQPITVTFYDGPPDEAGSDPIGAAQVIAGGLNGCADYAEVEIDWPDLGFGAHWFYVKVDSKDTIIEGDESNNVASGVLLVATEHSFIPLVHKNLDQD